MNKYQAYKLGEIRRLLDFKDSILSKIENNPFLISAFDKIAAIYTEILTISSVLDQSISSITKEKNTAFKQLTNLLGKATMKLISYGKYNNFEPFAEIKGCKMYELKRCAQEELLIHTSKIINLVALYSEETTKAGVTPENIQAITDAKEKATKLVDAPHKKKTSNKALNEQRNKLIHKYNAINNDTIKAYITSEFKDSDPDVYIKYKEVISEPKPSSYQYALKGEMKSNDGIPLKNVTITIGDQKPKKRGGEKGGYYFTHLEPGLHSIKFELKGYVTQTHHINIRAGITFVLNIEMEQLQHQEEKEVMEMA
ncbi:carboxypeptidase regulatory-like domain-containing protein [Prolixibacteraceae bacterium JC049]|nr:carboxypeptidase regulatory-like domain-containing protein [Prolixibacteraceae bacterium JC049]